MKMKPKGKIVHFIQDRREAAQEFIKLFPEDVFSQTFIEILKSCVGKSWGELKRILSDPVVFRIAFIVYMPPERFDLRVKLTYLSNPIRDRRDLIRFIKHHCDHKSGWKDYLRDLAHDFMVILSTDYQRLLGKSGTISELRENFEKISTDEDGTLKIEIDLWPKAKIIQLIKAGKIETRHYLREEEGKYEFSNLADEMMIEWMQSFEDRELRLAPYEFKKGDSHIYYIYAPDGKLIEKFPYALRNKYENLIRSKLRYYLAKKGIPFGWEKADVSQETELTFLDSIFKYTKQKGFPPGYFETVLIRRFHDIYQNARKASIDFSGGSLDKEMKSGTSIIKIIRSESKSALVSEGIRDILIEDPINRIIAVNLDESDSKIAVIIFEELGKSITKQAVQKRRVTKVVPLLKDSIEIGLRLAMKEDEDRQGHKGPPKKPEEK